jgi:DNA replication protein DnaC
MTTPLENRLGKAGGSMNIIERTVKGYIPNIYPSGDYPGEDGLLVCGKCHTPKEHRFSLPARDSGYEDVRVGFTPCKCRQAEIQAEKEAEKQRALIARVEQLRNEGITDPAYRRYTFANDDRKNKTVSNTCRKYVEKWNEMREKNVGILFFGSVGTGKSFYAGCIANALVEKQVKVCMTSFPRILSSMQGFGNSQTTIVDIRRCSLLIIDDLGAERDTSYSLEQVFAVIDERAKSDKPLIVTTNLSLEELQQPSRTEYARIYDRILEMCSIQIRMTGPSRRVEKATERREQAKQILGL